MGQLHRVIVVVSALGAATLGASACGLFPPGSPVDFCIEQARAYCDLQYRCCTAVERQNDPFGFFVGPPTTRHAPSSAGECVDLMAEVCRAGVEQQNESLANERIEYDADEANDCLVELRKAVDECDPATFLEAQGTYLSQLMDNGTPGILGGECEDAIQGAVDEGDECFASYECDKGQCVTQPGPNEVTSEGECAGDFDPGEPFQNIDFEICDGLDDEG